jgi:4,5-DOPA dioxygenase extradiol
MFSINTMIKNDSLRWDWRRVMKTDLMPVLFIGHGSPMNAIEENEFSRTWRRLGEEIPRPRAILCVSAHWETEMPRVTIAEQPQTIHDFYGFPSELHSMEYPAPGSPALANRVLELLADHSVSADQNWGMDHGTWSVLARMYPEADIPVVQLSLAHSREGNFHYEMGRHLLLLRSEGILILGSGNVVHNLRLM